MLGPQGGLHEMQGNQYKYILYILYTALLFN